MGILQRIKRLVENGLYYVTEHADEEAMVDGLDIYDIEYALLNGRIRKTWPKGSKVEVVGKSLSGSRMGVVCRITPGNKVRVITVYEDRS